MSCFLYPSTRPSPLLPPLTPPNSCPDPPPPALLPHHHDPPLGFPALERDYMGIGLGFKHLPSTDKAPASPHNPPSNISELIPSADHLCGSHLKLAPPSSSPDDSEADDGQPLSGNVGWPPISSYRKATTRLLSIKPPCNNRETIDTPLLLTPQASLISDNHDDNQECNANHDALENDAFTIKPFPTKPRKPLHIKVSMDGTPIMRKLDVVSMQGYQHLFLELRKLFKFYNSNLSCDMGVHSSFKDSKGANFILAYKDKEGDWMLIGDTPWKTFAQSAKRIRIMKTVE